MKMKLNAKKIVSIVIISLLVIIAAVTTTLSLVKINYNFGISKDNAFITLYKNGKEDVYNSTTNADYYNNIFSKLSTGLKENYLSALFQGGLSKKAKPSIKQETIVEIKNHLVTSDNIVIKISYQDAQVLKVNNKVYKNKDNHEIKYYDLYVEINDSNNLVATKFYVGNSFVGESGASHTVSNSNYQISTVSHLSNLYNYLNDIVLR